MKRKLSIGLLLLAAVFLIIGMICIYQGFNKKNNYHNSAETSYYENAYVGGDAYNIMINATYFSGYLAFASGMLINAVILGTTGAILLVSDMENLKREKSGHLTNGDVRLPEL